MGKGRDKKLVRAAAGFGTGGLSEVAYFGPQRAAQRAANAASGAALAQQQQAQINYDETAGIVNPATVAGLASFDRDIANQEKNLARQEQLISQIDPTIIEASQQALRLLRGEQSSTLQPLQNQRSQQRQKLLNSLREQLGPGAETSTAGIQALTRFDAETSNIMGGAQQQALSNLGGLSAQFTSQRPDMFREISGLSSFGQGKTALSYNQAGVLSNARMGLQQTAGAQFVGDAAMAQSRQAQYNQLTQLGGTLAGAAITGGMSGAAKLEQPGGNLK